MTPAEFAAYDAANPYIWRAFCSIVAEARSRGRVRWSADAVLHLVRWQTASDVNNDATAGYARKWLAKHPEAGRFFETRASAADVPPDRQMNLDF